MGVLHGEHQGKGLVAPPHLQPRSGQLWTQGSPNPDHQAPPWGWGWVVGLRVGPAWQGPCQGRAGLWYHWAGADGSRGLMWAPGLWAGWGKLQGLGRDSQVFGRSQGNDNANCKCSLSRWKKLISNLGYDVFRLKSVMWVCPQSISPSVKTAKPQTTTKTERNAGSKHPNTNSHSRPC